MGEIADMMLDGTLCEACGEYMEGSPGYPRTCAGCKSGEGAAPNEPERGYAGNKMGLTKEQLDQRAQEIDEQKRETRRRRRARKRARQRARKAQKRREGEPTQ